MGKDRRSEGMSRRIWQRMAGGDGRGGGNTRFAAVWTGNPTGSAGKLVFGLRWAGLGR
jgi:hypothetical protein